MARARSIWSLRPRHTPPPPAPGPPSSRDGSLVVATTIVIVILFLEVPPMPDPLEHAGEDPQALVPTLKCTHSLTHPHDHFWDHLSLV